MEQILQQRTLRPVKSAPPDERTVINPEQMDLEGNRCRMLYGKGFPFPFPETVDIPNHDPLRPKFVSQIAQDLPERGLEGCRRNTSIDPGDTFPCNDAEFRFAFSQVFQKAGFHKRFRSPGGLRGAEDHSAERTAHNAAVQVFRNDLLKGNHGDPVEDDLPLLRGDACVPTIVATEDRLKETKDQEAIYNLLDTVRFYDGFNPLVSDGGRFFLCRGDAVASDPSIYQSSAFQRTLGGENAVDSFIDLNSLAQGAGKGLENRLRHMMIIRTIDEVDVQRHSAMV
jgi:hypothetical protein